jgi:hypothetical protein
MNKVNKNSDSFGSEKIKNDTVLPGMHKIVYSIDWPIRRSFSFKSNISGCVYNVQKGEYLNLNTVSKIYSHAT